jgi:hypothetical protein
MKQHQDLSLNFLMIYFGLIVIYAIININRDRVVNLEKMGNPMDVHIVLINYVKIYNVNIVF